MRTLALTSLLLLGPQESGTVTLDQTGSLEEVVQALAEASGAPLRVSPEVDSKKEFSIRVKGAGFFEALDTVCRAHGKVTYLEPPKAPDEGQIELRPGAWTEFPSSYSKDFKVIVSEMVGFTSATLAGNEKWNRVCLCLLGPPWLNVREVRGTKSHWEIDEALDAQGNDVRAPVGGPEPAPRVDFVWHASVTKGNVVPRVFRLRAFDTDRGLRSLKGSAEVTVNTTKEVDLALAVGTTAETSVGTFAIESVKEIDPTPLGSYWKIGVSLKAAAGLKNLAQALEPRFRCGGKGLERSVFTVTFPREGWTFTATVRRTASAPQSLRLLVREGENRVQVPFEFKNVRF